MNITQISHRTRTIALSLFSLTLLCSSPSHSTNPVLDHEQEDKPSLKPFTYKELNVQINSEDGKLICLDSKWIKNEQLIQATISTTIIYIEWMYSVLASGDSPNSLTKTLPKQDGTPMTYQEYYHYLHGVRKRMCYQHCNDDVPVTPAAVPTTRDVGVIYGPYIDQERITLIPDFIVVWTRAPYGEDNKLERSTICHESPLLTQKTNPFKRVYYGIHQIGYKLYSSGYTYRLRENLKDPNDQTRVGLDRFLDAALSDDFMTLLKSRFTLDALKAETIINFPNQIFVEDITSEQLSNNKKVFRLGQCKGRSCQESMASIVETLLCTSDLPYEIQELVMNQTLCLIYRRYMENLRISNPKGYEYFNTIEKTFQNKAS